MPTNLRIRLESGPHALALTRVHRVTGFAALTGQPDEYFQGWMRFHGKLMPVFDLNRVICETPTPESFGSRIVVVKADAVGGPVPYIGLLAPGVTDTVKSGDKDVTELDLDLYLQMLANFIPPVPANV